jgi:glyoxylase-like metal-dependent hydrolase (beta-lactamase superfamily II)
MFFRQFIHQNGCVSYMFGCGSKGKAVVVDPQKDPDLYLKEAQKQKVDIIHVIDTHTHADHLSGARILAERLGIEPTYHRNAKLNFSFNKVEEGDVLEAGNTIVEVLHTPGHTPDSISLVVKDRRRGEEIWFVLTGDTLFIGDVGRPDLGYEDPREGARLIFRSIHDKLLTLPDYVEIFPAHIAGSVCGRYMSGKPSSTIGFEKKFNLMLKIKDEKEFVNKLVEGIPPKPRDMDKIVKENRGLP